MSETFKVESVLDRSEWEGNYGPMVTYRLRANGQEVDLNQKPETPAPAEGQEIWGHLEDGKFRPKLKKDPRPDGSGGSSASGGSSKRGGEWKPESQYDPEKVARITRAHSQEMAVRLLCNRADFNEAPKAQRQQAIKAWADWFDADVQQAATTALAKSSLNATETPAVRPAAADGEIVDEGGVPF